MVLVAPTPPPLASDRPAPGRDEVLALLRDGAGARPRFDPGLAGGLRAWLEDAAWAVVEARGEGAPPLVLGARWLSGGGVAGGVAGGTAPTDLSPRLITACLVHALFRQIVTTGAVGDPWDDGLHALRVDPSRAEVVAHLEALPAPARSSLAASLAVHAEHLLDLTPRFAAGWLPRTDDHLAIPLAGGRVVLQGVFDLVIGAPVPGRASLCAVGLTSGGPWERARRTLHFVALLETLRSGTPPFRLALLHSAAGRYGVEDVQEEQLRAMVSHIVAGLSTLAAGHG
jgi:hypothetical protein